jgi:TP901 family phage tail tape measure protein
MARIELNVVALGDFSSVNSQIKTLQTQVELLQKSLAGVGVNSTLAKDLNSISASFKQTMLSTGQFTQQTVKMQDETVKFGQALEAGKLKLTDYYNIIRMKSSQAVTQMRALAVEQTKLQNSIVVNDPTKQGILNVYTPTQINKVANATRIATNEANLYAIAVNKGSQSLINWGKNTQWAGRQLTVGMSMPLLLFGSQAVSAFKDVNTELTRLQRLYGEGLTPPSQTEINAISNQVLNLGKNVAQTMGIAQNETVKVAANFAAMGRQGKDLLDTTYQTQRLSKLGAVDATAATNTVVALQNVYKVSTNQLADAVNFLSDIQKQTTMTLGDMTEAIPRVGPIMQQLGGTYKDTAVMLVAMREAGIPAAQAANAVKSAVASMIAPTAAASKEWAQYGINLTSIKNSTQGNPVQMIEDLQMGLAKLSPLVKEQLIEKLFGKFQFARVSALLENFGKQGSQTQNALKVAGATSAQLAGLANQEMKQATESTTAQFQRAMATFKADLYPVGDAIMKFGTKILDFGNKVAKLFNGLPGPIKTVMGGLAIGVALAGPIIMLTGLMGNFIGYLIKGAFNLKQLATGGKTLGQMLTPEMIAAQNASALFNTNILENVSSVGLLEKAIKDLTTSIDGMVTSLNAGTGIQGLLNTVGAAATTEARVYEQLRLPGFAGGLVPGSGDGKTDTFPAMLAPGEAVIDAETTRKNLPFIKAMMKGQLPGFNKGTPRFKMNPETGEGEWLAPHGSYSTSDTQLSGSALMVSEISGDADKAPQIIREAIDELKKLGNVNLNLSSSAQHQLENQTDLSHRSMSSRTQEDDKVFRASELYALRRPENQAMSTISEFSKDIAPDDSAALKAKKAYMDKIIKEASDSVAGIKPEEIAGFKAGVQPVTKAEQELYQKVLNKVVQDVKDTANEIPGANSPFLHPEITGGRRTFSADKSLSIFAGASGVTNARSQGRLSEIEQLQLSKYIDSDKAKPLALKAYQSVAPNYDAGTGRRNYNVSSIANSNKPVDPSFEKPLKQQLKILQEAEVQDVEAIKHTQIAIRKAQLQGAQDRMADLEKQKKTETDEYKILGQQVAQGFIDGVISKKSEAAKASAMLVEETIVAIKTAAEIASPSKVMMTLGKWFGLGWADGVKSTIPEAEAAGAALAEASQEGAQQSSGLMGGIKNRLFNNKLGFAGRTGLAVGAMTVATMSTPMLKKIPGVGNELSTAAQWGGMAAMTGQPELIALAAGAGFAYSGIKHLMDIEKEHKAQAAATFKSSADAVQFFGGQVADTTHTMLQFQQAVYSKDSGANSSLIPGLNYTGQQLKNFSEMVKGLPKDNPLSLVIEKLKDTGNAGAAKDIAEQFVKTQMAINGIDKSQADHMLQLILGMSGHDATGSSVGVANQMQAIKSTLASMKPDTQAFKDFVGQISNIAINTTSWDTYKSIIDAIGSSALTSQRYVDGLIASLQSAGDWQGANNVSLLKQQGFTTRQISDFTKAQALGLKINTTGTDMPGYYNVKPDKSETTPSAATKKLETDMQAANKKKNDANTATAKQTAAISADLNSQIKDLEKAKKVIDAQLKTEQNITSELQRQQQYMQKQADLQNKIRTARAGGDFLQSAMLQQEMITNQTDYSNQSNVNKLQMQSDTLAQQIADKQDLANKAQTAAQSAATTAATGVSGALTANTIATDKNTGQLLINNPLDPKTPMQFGSPEDIYKRFPNLKPSSRNNYGVSPSDYNDFNPLQLPGVTSRDNIKRLAQQSHLPKDSYFQITQDGKVYTFKVLDDNGKVQMEGITPSSTSAPVKKAFGGLVSGPGSNMSDSIQAMLSNGEYVMNASSVSSYGVGFMSAINNRSFNPSFPQMSQTGLNVSQGGTMGNTYNITVNAETNADANQIAKVVIDTIKRQNAMTQTTRSVRV